MRAEDLEHLVRNKRALRARLLARRGAQEPAAVAAASSALRHNLLTHPAWLGARGLAAFVGVRGEAHTRPLLHATLEAGKRLWLPRVLGGGHMRFWPVDDLSTLVEGRMGLLEPPGLDPSLGRPAPGPEDGVDLVLVPGLGFDRHGGRIGFGAGHYDRAFGERLRQGLPMPTLCGLCLHDFLDPDGERIPMAAHDLRMAMVVSDQAVVVP